MGGLRGKIHSAGTPRQFRAYDVAIRAQFIRTLREGGALRRRSHGWVSKKHRSTERGGIGGAIQVRAVTLGGARGVMEMDVAALIDRGPVSCIRKLRR